MEIRPPPVGFTHTRVGEFFPCVYIVCVHYIRQQAAPVNPPKNFLTLSHCGALTFVFLHYIEHGTHRALNLTSKPAILSYARTSHLTHIYTRNVLRSVLHVLRIVGRGVYVLLPGCL
jgi:hypothetical protein